MNTTKQDNEEVLVGPFTESNRNVEISSGIDQVLSVGKSILSSCISKNKSKPIRVLASAPSNARNNFSPDNYQEKRRVKDSKKGMRLRAKVGLSDRQKRFRMNQQQSSFKRRLWTTEEDKAITSLVQQHGIRKWTLISRKLQEKFHVYGRSGKQCRERFVTFYKIDGIITWILM